MHSDRLLFVSRLCVLTVFVLPLAGCGGGDSTDTASSDGSAAKDAVASETDAMMGMDGSAPGGADAGGHGMDPMAMSAPGGDDLAMDPGMAGGEMGADPSMEMQMQMEGGYSGGPGGPGESGTYGQPGVPQKPARPADVNQWTDEQLVEAVEDRDPRVLQAIHVKAENAKGNPEFAKVMTRVLQQGASVPTVVPAGGTSVGGATTGGLGIPGLPALFGGSGDDPAEPTTPTAPTSRPAGGKPPGGASYNPGMDSLSVMLGEAMLSYVPQAVQGTRGAAERLQNAAASPPGMEPGMLDVEPGGADPGEMNSMMEGMEGTEGYGGYQYGNNQAGQGKLETDQLVRAIAEGLVLNDTPQAWEMLNGIATGSVPTSLPAATNLEIVLAEVFEAETINLPVAQQLLTSAMTAVATAPADNQSTARFLAALAQNPTDYFLSLSDPTPPPGAGVPAAPGRGTAGQPGAEGMTGMEAGMMGSGRGDYAGEMAGEGMAGMMGMGSRPKPVASPLPSVHISEAAMAPVAAALWNPAAVDAVASQLASADSPAAVPEVLALASTIPADRVRQAMSSLFAKSHEQGAMELIGAGLFQHVARDPGMMTVLKSLPRPRPERKSPANADAAAAAPAPTESWTEATLEVVLSLRDRLRKVADDPALKHDGLQRLRLHRDAIPEKSIVIKGPNEQAAALGEAAPSETTIYYTACRVAPMRASDMQAIVDHYERRSKGIKHEDRARGILWYDGVKENEDGTLETMDIIVEQIGAKPQQGGPGAGYEGGAGGESGGGPGGTGQTGPGGVQFSIEVLVVITKNPGMSGTTAAVTATESADIINP